MSILQNVLEVTYEVRLNDIGPDSQVRNHIIFDYLQDSAARHAGILGVGMSSLRDLNIIWVLARMQLHMDRYPKSGETVLVRTYPKGLSRLFAVRHYELFNKETGERYGYASSFWLTLDWKTLRPLNPAQIVKEHLPKNEEKEGFLPDPGKLPQATGCGDSISVTAAQSHIDYNDHMNNAYYVMFTQDYLAHHFQRSVFFHDIKINFNTSVKFGESFQCIGDADPETGAFTVSGILPDGRNVFTAAGIFEFKPSEK